MQPNKRELAGASRVRTVVRVSSHMQAYASKQSGAHTHLLDVMESVLCDVCHAHIGVLPHCALIWQQLACEQLDHCGLARTIGAHDCHSGVEGALQCDIGDDLPVCAWVPAHMRQQG